MRNVPILLRHYAKTSDVPETMALGFATFLLFMKTAKNADNKYEGTANGKSYGVQDDNVAYFAENWQGNNSDAAVDKILADTNFWGADLSALPGFADSVKNNLNSLVENGAAKTMAAHQLTKIEG